MKRIFGRDYTPAELRELMPTMDQIAGVRLFELVEGKARGMRAAEVYTGGGLRFTVWIDRGLDIGPAEVSDAPLAWLHPALGAPAFFDPHGAGWARTFGGGLVTTCGLSHFGQPQTSEGQDWGLHGRISHTPPTQVSTFAGWEGDEYVLRVEGEVRETVLPGVNLRLNRRISTSLGEKALKIEDTVTNDSFSPTPHMMLYHINLGFPLLAPGSVLEVDDISLTPRDAAAAAGLAESNRFGQPVPGYQEQVFFHQPRPAADGYVTARLINANLGMEAYVRYRAAELPTLTQWKMIRSGIYVCGLEPCTGPEGPREQRRAEGHLRDLAPGQSVHYEVQIGVL